MNSNLKRSNALVKIIVLGLLFIYLPTNAQTKQITLEHKGGYVARFTVTWQEYGQTRTYESGNGKSVNWTKSLSLNQKATNINITVEALNIFTYGSACTKNVGSSPGTFTAGGLLGNVSCDWSSDDLSASSGEATSNLNINELLPGGNTHLHIAVRSQDLNQAKSLLNSGITHIETKNSRGFTPLHEAIQVKSNEMVTLLVNNGANIFQTNNKDQSALYMAVNLGDVDIVQNLFDNGYQASNAELALERAIMKRDMPMVNLFVDNNADANVVLNMAVKSNNAEIIQLAIDAGATPTLEVFKKAVDTRKFTMAQGFLENDLSDIDPNAALEYAILKNSKPLVKSALNNGGNAQKALDYAIKVKDKVLASDAISMHQADANLPLNTVIGSNNIQLLEVLLTNGADASKALGYALTKNNLMTIKKVLEFNPTVASSHVSQVASVGNNEILKLLIEQGQGDPNDGMNAAMNAKQFKTAELLVQANATVTAEHMKSAAMAGKNELLKIFIQNGQADANDGLAPAMSAAQYKTAEYLIQAGATPDNIVKTAVEKKQKSLLISALDNNADPNPGLMAAIKGNSTEYAKLLIEKGASANEDSFMTTAAKAKNLPMVNLLLGAGGNAEAGLAAAVTSNAPDIVSVLLKSGANGANNELLRSSVAHDNVALTKLLVDAGSDPNAGIDAAVKSAPGILGYFVSLGTDVSDQKFLTSAINSNNSDTAKIIIQNGGDALYVDGAGNTYVHTAALKNNSTMVRLIVENGQDINAVNASGDAALHIAVRGGRKQSPLVTTIIGLGADVNLKDKNRQTALSYAKGSKVKKALKGAGAVK